MPDRPRITVFGPNPLLTVTVEQRGPADDIHVHAAGQGVWVARMAAELGGCPVLCGFLGGETGAMLLPLLQGLGGEVSAVTTAGASGSYVTDRREHDRRLVAASLATAPSRHEIDDLVAATVAAMMTSRLLVLCNPYPASTLPDDVYETVSAAARDAGVPVVADLSTPRVDRVLPSGPALIKLNNWELAEYVCGPVDGPRGLVAAHQMIDRGAMAVAVTAAQAPILVVPAEGDPYEIVPPRLSHGYREGCGDAMTGATAAALAHGRSLQDSLVLGAAAGSGNFLRHGLGTGRRPVIETLAERIIVRPIQPAAETAGAAGAS